MTVYGFKRNDYTKSDPVDVFELVPFSIEQPEDDVSAYTEKWNLDTGFSFPTYTYYWIDRGSKKFLLYDPTGGDTKLCIFSLEDGSKTTIDAGLFTFDSYSLFFVHKISISGRYALLLSGTNDLAVMKDCAVLQTITCPAGHTLKDAVISHDGKYIVVMYEKTATGTVVLYCYEGA